MRLRPGEETIAGVVFFAYALFLHALFWRHAGPLWRDEAVSAAVSRTPWPQFLDRLQFDSFPALWLLLLRGWTALFGDGVASLRTLGVLTGIAILGAIWFALRTLDVRVPMLAIALAGAAATVVRFGDALRAYGLGAALGLVSMALLYRGRFLLGGLVSLAAVHTTYQNAPLLLACCIGAAIVHRKRAAIVLGIGALCAASLLIYLPTMQKVKAWSGLLRYDISVGWLLARFRDAADLGGGLGVWAWIVLLIAALALARNHVFCAIVLAIYTTAQIVFLLVLRYHTQPWYYLIWMAVAAVLIDATIVHAPPLQLLRAAAALFILLLGYSGTRAVVAQRMTNVDVVAAVLARDAAPNDLIVVYPWHLGASFHRYYRGAAPWQTLPPLRDHTVQRYDEARKAMFDGRERALIAAVTDTLRRGGRVWYAGYPLFMEQSIIGAKDRPQVQADARWSSALRDALRGTQPTMVVRPDPRTNPNENIALLRIAAP
jgi:hypothetical protein